MSTARRASERRRVRGGAAAPLLRLADGTPVGIVHLTAEYAPYARTGGLAEAVEGLARYQARAGIATIVVMPLYGSARELAGALEPVGAPIGVDLDGRHEEFRVLRQSAPPDGPRVYFLEHPRFFDRAGVYGEAGRDYPDNAERWAFFSRAAVAALPGLVAGPFILHAHDWHTALALVYLRSVHRGNPWYDAIRTELSVHTAGYQGHYPPEMCRTLGIPPALFNWRRLEWYGQLNVLKGGLVFADAVVTVSPNHARELCTPDGGFGLHGVFSWLGPRFVGILNGIDQRTWDPSSDAFIAARYGGDDLGPKTVCKRVVQRHFGLDQHEGIPLFVMAARLVTQKGIDLILADPQFFGLPAQFAFLGAGEQRFEQALHELSRAFPGRVAVDTRFSDRREHELMAAGDFLLMPCQYEPCGLTQMRAQRYGALPVVRRVGGLADTVDDGVTGFVFDDYAPEPLLGAALRAVDAWSDPVERERLRGDAMRRDFGWERSAERYAELYARVLSGETTVEP